MLKHRVTCQVFCTHLLYICRAVSKTVVAVSRALMELWISSFSVSVLLLCPPSYNTLAHTPWRLTIGSTHTHPHTHIKTQSYLLVIVEGGEVGMRGGVSVVGVLIKTLQVRNRFSGTF